MVQEACLSVPGYQGEIKRSATVKIKAQDRQGREIRLKGEELLAQALEHEPDFSQWAVNRPCNQTTKTYRALTLVVNVKVEA